MKLNKLRSPWAVRFMACVLAGSTLLGAAENTNGAGAATTTTAASQNDEIARLKAALAEQQKQLQSLQQAIEKQQQMIEQAATRPNNLGTVASLTPVIPAAPIPAVAIPAAQTAAKTTASNPCEANPDGSKPAPAYLQIGSTCLVPVGFMDLTSVWRDKNAGSSMGSNFGSIPYNNTVNGNLSEFRFTPQNSRLGFRFDGDWKGTHFIGYNEFDFNGTSGSTSLAVSNGAIVPRLRLFWVDVRRSKIEFLAGQSWSLLTPNRSGLSALPGDLFYTQATDINYMAGLTWTRQPGMRVLYHANDKVTFGFSAELSDQYSGGSAGGSGITLPAAYSALNGTQLDNSQNISAGGYLAEPTVMPDLIAKLALDPSKRFHFEVGGVVSEFKTVNPASLGQHFSATGSGVLVGLNAEVVKNLRLISTNFWGQGEGRYLFGQAPDLIVRANGTLSPVHSGGTIDGFEVRPMPKILLYAYYGGIYIGRDTAIDASGSLIGYGYKGSANSQNRSIDEFTFGFNQTMWSNPRYGAVNLMGQYEWLMRDPWYVAAGAPKNTHDNTIYFNIRYSLPGATPKF